MSAGFFFPDKGDLSCTNKLTLCLLASCCLSVVLRDTDTDIFSTWHQHKSVLMRPESAETGLVLLQAGGYTRIIH